MSWFIGCYKKFADFSGRARRKEYWMFILFFWVTLIVLMMLASTQGLGGDREEELSTLGSVTAGILALYYFGSLLPLLAVSVRRLHDTDKSGWWLLLNLIPGGGLVILVFMIMAGTPGQNRFGENPIG